MLLKNIKLPVFGMPWRSCGVRGTWWRHQMKTFSTLLAICAGNSPHKGQWRGALVFSLICVCINVWVNNREAGDLRRYRDRYDVIVMIYLNMVHNYICLYMHIVHFHFWGAFVIFFCNYLCFNVDTIFSAYWWKLRVLFVQLKMLYSQTKDNGHAGSIHLTRLKWSQLCWCSSRWIFWSCSSQGSTRDQTH